MNIYGIVAEFNPFHNGHKYLISKIKEKDEDSIIVVVLSSSFVQRGEPAILSKWDRSSIALEYGVNLVVELPFVFACQNAEVFAKGAISILDKVNISHLVFGAEDPSPNILKTIAKKMDYQSKKIDTLIKEKMNSGQSYIVAKNNSLKDLDILDEEELKILSQSNNILAIEYIKAINKINPRIEIKPIQRFAVGHNSNEIQGSFASGSKIRKLFFDNKNYFEFLPSLSKNLLKNSNIYKNDLLLNILKYKLLILNDRMDLQVDFEIGLDNRIKHKLISSKDYYDLINKVANKRITKSRVNRLLTNYILNVTSKDIFLSLKNHEYVRILGMDTTGIKYLKELDKNYINRFVNYKNFNPPTKLIGDIEIKASNLYSLLTNRDFNQDFIISPIINKN